MKGNVLEYKGYYTEIEYSVEDNVLFGKIEAINDLVTFDSESANGIEKSFHEAVDDYLDFCAEVGKKPDKAFKGSFNVRTTPQLHRASAVEAFRRGCTLNQFVSSALTHELAHAYDPLPPQT